jgi:hypothetical protein
MLTFSFVLWLMLTGVSEQWLRKQNKTKKKFWLPNQNGFKVWSQNRGNIQGNLVKDLIDPSTNQWNHQLINQTFLPFEANQIFQIPLVDRNSTDELAWAGEKDGRYTVKSGYRAIIEWKSLQSNLAGSTNLVTNPQWKHLWKLKIPPKQGNLLWRIFQNVLP